MPEVVEEVMVTGEKAVAPKTTVQDCVTTFVSSQLLVYFYLDDISNCEEVRTRPTL